MNPISRILSWASVCIALVVSALAQSSTGTLTGTVSNAATGAQLEGAIVSIGALGRQELTDATGRYRFAALPAGEHRVEVSYTGLDVARQTVSVTADRANTANIELVSGVYQLAQFTVTGEREGSAASITRQRNADNVKSVVSLDAFGNLANESPGELLVRLPGVTPRVTDDGDVFAIYVRGTDSQLNSVTIDGNKMATSGPLNREFRFLNLSASFFDELEVVKAPTPDLDADSIGGAVNMKTKSILGMKEKRRFNYRIGAKWASSFWEQTPTREKHPIHPLTSLGYQEVFSVLGGERNLGVSLGAFYSENASSFGNTIRDYAFSLADPAYVYDYRTVDGYNVRTQRSINAKVDYRLAPGTRLTFSGMINDAFESLGHTYSTRAFTSRTIAAIGANGQPTGTGAILPTFTDTFTEVRPVNNSIFEVTSGTSGFFDRQRRAQLDLEHDLGRLDLDGSLSWSRSRVAQSADAGGGGSFVSDVRAVGWQIDLSQSEEFPAFTQTAGPDITDPRSYGVSRYTRNNSGRRGQVYVMSGNARYDLGLAQPTGVKGGFRWRRQESAENGGDRRWNFAGPDGVVGVNPATGRNDDDLAPFLHPVERTSGYRLGAIPFAHVGSVARHLKENPTHWREDLYFGESDPFLGTREVAEEVTAGYLMANTRIARRLGVVAGVRVERTEVEGEGWARQRTRTDITDPVARVAAEFGNARRTVRGNYTDTFPGVHVKYAFNKRLLARASWSTSIGRPAFTALVPREDVNLTAQTITVNNPSLKPQYADSYDASLEYYFEPVGLLSAGVFQKDLRDFIFNDSGGVVGAGPDNGFGGEYAGYSIATQGNGGRARIRGFELSYQQQFAFLPGWLAGFSGFANYTYLTTEGDYGTSGGSRSATQVQRFIPKSGNVGVSYNRGRLRSRAMVNYVGEHLFTFNANPSRLRYKEARTTVNLSLGWQFTRALSVYCDTSNIFDEPQRYYIGLGKKDRLQSFVDNAPVINFGVSGSF